MDIEAEDLLPQLRHILLCRHQLADHACVADKDIELLEALIKRRGEAVDGGGIQKVERDERCAAARILDLVIDFFEPADGAGDKDDMRAFTRKFFGDFGANAA